MNEECGWVIYSSDFPLRFAEDEPNKSTWLIMTRSSNRDSSNRDSSGLT